MKQMLRVILGCVAVGTLVLASGPAQAQLAVSSQYYATPAWNQQLACTPGACPRFLVLTKWNSEAVLDKETGLVWERSPDTNGLLWVSAHQHCNNLIVGNRKGWRLPTIQELASLVDPSVFQPGPPLLALPPGHPFQNVQVSAYWSATTRNGTDGTEAWLVEFGGAAVDGEAKATSAEIVWCVRGGQGVDPQ